MSYHLESANNLHSFSNQLSKVERNQGIQTIDFENIKIDTTKTEFDLSIINYPIYWRGLNLKSNSYEVIELSAGEFPSIQEYLLNWKSNSSYGSDYIKITPVQGENINRYNLSSKACNIFVIKDEKYLLCKSWLDINPNTNTYVSTNCSVTISSMKKDVRCLFPDYIQDTAEFYQQNSSICVVEKENLVCDSERFSNYVFNFYKFNIFSN